jgi:two-component system, OmpR family, phosphate regulon sensor histidine kinase PhoR
MDKRKFLIIVIASALSLLGVIIIQFFWIRNAVRLQEEEFNNRIEAGLKLVVNDIFKCQQDTCSMKKFCTPECGLRMEILPGSINKHLLDSIVRSEFNDIPTGRGFVYGMINARTNSIETISDPNYKSELLASRHSESLSCIFNKESYKIAVFFAGEQSIIYSKILGWLLICLVFLGFLIYGFTFTILSYLKQKKLSEMKNDFVNNMTHEFKTPIATISLSGEMLLKPEVYREESKVRKYARIISDENRRLKAQVENVLQIAVLEKGEYSLKKSEFDLHKMISQVICNYSVHIKERAGNVHYVHTAEKHCVLADPVHIQNILTNLLDNANKYSEQSPDITIETRNENNGILVSFTDKGPGISIENQKHVFKKLYRVSTGNLHNVKGFGLGLYYVKTMVEAHGGYIHLSSELNKGSTFSVFLPQ